MKSQSKNKFQSFILIVFCLLLFFQNFATSTTGKSLGKEVLIEKTSETDSESSEKIPELEIECEDVHLHSNVFSFFVTSIGIQFPSLNFKFSFPFSDGIEFPPEF